MLATHFYLPQYCRKPAFLGNFSAYVFYPLGTLGRVRVGQGEKKSDEIVFTIFILIINMISAVKGKCMV